MLNQRATTEPTENEDGFWEDGFEVDTDRARLVACVNACNQHIAKGKDRKPETREDFGLTQYDGAGRHLRRKRMGSTWDITKHYLVEFGRFAGMVPFLDGDVERERWVVLIKDLFGQVYAVAEYTSMEELHKVWELD